MNRSSGQTAFSLIELLAVIAIIAMLLAFTLPAFNSTLQGIQLTQGAQMLSEQIHLARQTALTKNRSIEVRFYRYVDSNANGASGKRFFRALQSFEINDDGTAKPIGKMHRVPNAIILDSSPTLSPLLDTSRLKAWNPPLDPQISLPGIGTSYDAYAFTFRNDGSANLSVANQQWFVSLHNGNAGDNLGKLPADFAVLQIDPWNGQTRLFRP